MLILDTVCPIVGAWIIYRYVIAPWRREGRLGVDGMLCIAWLSMYFIQDTVQNWLHPNTFFNSAAVNIGSWYSQIPGWQSANAHLNPEPLLHWIPLYTIVGFAISVLGTGLLRRLHARFPAWGRVRVVGCMYLFMIALDSLVEGAAVWMQDYVFAASVRPFALWPGTIHQFPIYEAVLWGAVWTTLSAYRHYRDDKGRLLTDRGLDSLDVSARGKQTLRLLAVIGFANLAMFCLYMLPQIAVSTQHDNFITDLPPYLLNGICDQYAVPGTPGACLPTIG